MNLGPVIRKSVAFRQIDEKIVTRVAKQKGLDFSSALRTIIREWAEQNQAHRTTDRGDGYQAGQEK